MSTGTTQDSVIKRNRVVELALRAVRAVKPGQAASNNDIRDGVALLNEILREDDQEQTGIKKSLWAMSENHILLAANRTIHSTTEGLASDLQDPDAIYYRDTNGEDTLMKLVSEAQYEALTPKDETGDPECALLVMDRVLSSQTLRIWPTPTSVGTTSVVEGSDALQYSAILGHTSTAETKPITGSSWRLFWRQTGSGGSAWVTATEYTNGALLRINYKRPLFDFDLADSDPDMPAGWGNYLKWRLAIELSPNYKVSLEERMWFENQMKICLGRLFPGTRSKGTDYHNKATYF